MEQYSASAEKDKLERRSEKICYIVHVHKYKGSPHNCQSIVVSDHDLVVEALASHATGTTPSRR